MDLFPEGTKMEDLVVEANFSETRARVLLKDGALCEGFLLGGHFKQGSEACLVLAQTCGQMELRRWAGWLDRGRSVNCLFSYQVKKN